MQIRILGHSVPELKQGKKAQYSEFVLTYSQDGTNKTKKVFSFHKEIYTTLLNSVSGDFYDIRSEKNGDFWEWKAVTKVQAHGVAEAGAASAQPTETKNYGARTYETAEERAKKQVFIIRQSSFSNAVAALGSGHSFDDYVSFARDIEAYVFDLITPTVEDDTEIK